MHQVKINNFQGPLSLLLDLIEQNKLDISQVSLSEVADQYLAKLDSQRAQISGDELADWLLLAAKLLVIKSRSLLPILDLPAEEPGELERQLRMYKAYRDASRIIKDIIAARNFTFGRSPFKPKLAVAFAPPEKLSGNDLRVSLLKVIAALDKTIIRLPHQSLKRVISLTERIGQLKSLLQAVAEFGFHDFLKSAQSRGDVVISFLALLELIKQRALVAVQAEEEIIITPPPIPSSERRGL